MAERKAQACWETPDKIWNRSFVSIFAVNMALTLAQYMSNAILSLYAGTLGAESGAIGMLMSIFAVSSILFRCISGPIMDSCNRKHIVIIAAAIGAASYMGFGISGKIELLFGFRLLQGCGMAFGNACCLAMVSQVLPKDKYGAGIGYYSVAQVISQSVGNPLGLFLASALGYRLTFAVNAAVMLFAAFLASRVRVEFVKAQKPRFTLSGIIAKEALLPSFVIFCIMNGFVVVNSFLALYAREKGISGNTGLYFTVAAVTMVITRPVMGRLTDKYGTARILIPCLLANIVTFFMISFARSIYEILLAGFISAFGFGACQPALQALSMKSVSGERRGAASSTNYIGMDLGHLFGPSAAGIAAQIAGYEAMWRIMTIPFLVGIMLAFIFRRKIADIESNFENS